MRDNNQLRGVRPAFAMNARAGAVRPEELSLAGKILAVLKGDTLVTLLVLAGITVGFFHGWLKLNYPHPAVTFLFDALLLLALVLVYLKHDRRKPFFPKGPIGAALLGFYTVCIVYAVLPLGPPWLVSVAALRGWCFATLMYALGFHMTNSVRQVKGYFYVLVILGVITAGYGIRQSPEEIERRMGEDQYVAARLFGTYYSTGTGKRQMRRFSTFVTAGVFGSVMAYVILFAVALVSEPEARNTERLLLAAAIVPMAYGIVLSGARSALITLGIGFLVVAWHRRKLLMLGLIPAAVYMAMKWGASYTEGASLERFGTLLRADTILGRFLMPVMVTWIYAQEAILGGGLGRSGYSVPFILAGKTGYTDFRGAEGDLPALMVEMGIIGLLLFLRVLWVTARMVYNSLKELRDTPASTVALASAACIVLALLAFPIGSPFLSIPTGALTWFFVGTLQKLAESHGKGALEAAAAALEPPAPEKEEAPRYLYYRPKRERTPKPKSFLK